MFLGAGSAATGIADLTLEALVKMGLPEVEARRRLWFVDLKGLVVSSRDDLLSHNLPYAHDHSQLDFASAIAELRPTALIGATGSPGTFTRPILELMADINERPIIFALSNPTAKAECTAEEAYRWTEGRAIFASGSPFDPVEIGGERFVPGQGNNAYVFPGVGFGAIASGTTRITDDMFLAAADALAGAVREESLTSGSIYPPLTEIREVSVHIAIAVAEVAYEAGLATKPRPVDIEEAVRSRVWEPDYEYFG
jgi:malate dehydrogenase (oxaloacetate-decarboxylating)(NADP+)